MTDIARSLPGVYGVRMMGGGFGGCCVVFVENSYVDGVVSALGSRYKQSTGRDATILPSTAGQGALVAPLAAFTKLSSKM